MLRNRNGYWMSPEFYAMYEPDDGGGNGGAGAGGEGDPAGDGDEAGNEGGEENKDGPKDALAAELEKLKAEMARQKKALDDATKEAAGYKRELRAKQTQEEIDEANKREADEKAAKELEELRKEVARAKSTKAVMSKLGVDEDAAGKIAECLVGCENIDAALLEIQKVWVAKEKALRKEFGKIPGPGAGGADGEDAEEKAAIERAKRLGKERAESDKSVSDGLKGYMR